MSADMRVAENPEVRIGGAELELREHMPIVLRRLKERWPMLRFKLRTTGFLSEVETWLLAGEIDVAFAPLYSRPHSGLRSIRLAVLPLILQVHRKSAWKSAAELWRHRKISDALICLPESTGITREFHGF